MRNCAFYKIVKYRHDEDGAVAIEFALLSLPFMLLALGIIELAFMFATGSILEGATGAAARMIRTGQIQQGGEDPETAFRNALCANAPVLIRCSGLQLEVIAMADGSFLTAGGLDPEYDEDGNLDSGGFDAGADNDVVLVRVAYRYQMMTPLLGNLMLGEGASRLLMSTLVLQTEPYEFDGGA